MTILAALLGFHLLVLVHELGHFLVARATGMRVERVSIGFGPALLTVHGRHTVYKIGLLPIGGVVQVAGLGRGANPDDVQPDSYFGRPLWARAAMLAAGPIFNVLFAVGLYLLLSLTFNTLRFETQTQALTVVARAVGPAAAAGLLKGDLISSVGSVEVVTFRQLKAEVAASEGRALELTVRRPPQGSTPPLTEREVGDEAPGLFLAFPQATPEWETLHFTLTPESTPRGYFIGIQPDLARFGTHDLRSAVRYALSETWSMNLALFGVFGKWFRGEEAPQVATIVKIAGIAADRIELGVRDWYMDLLAALSMNLAFINLLPFPALDGGRLLFVLFEAVTRRKVPRKLEATMNAAGFVILFGLMFIMMGIELWEALGLKS